MSTVEIIERVLAVAGVLSLFTTPIALWSLIGLHHSCARLSDRNAAQAAMLGDLRAAQRDLERLGGSGRVGAAIKPQGAFPGDLGHMITRSAFDAGSG